jgi:hypothetical protein
MFPDSCFEITQSEHGIAGRFPAPTAQEAFMRQLVRIFLLDAGDDKAGNTNCS